MRNRIIVMLLITLALCSLIVLRMFHLQVDQHLHYSVKSEKNRIFLQPIPPTRGLIYDQDGVILADNISSFDLVVAIKDIKDVDEFIRRVQQYISLTEKEIQRFKDVKKVSRRYAVIALKRRLTEKEMAVISANNAFIPELDIKASLMRDYPYAEDFAHSIGHIARINLRDAKTISAEAYGGTDVIGRLGIEREYEHLLLGDVGVETVEKNNIGRVVRVLETQPPKAGQDLQLFLSKRLQDVIYSGFVQSGIKLSESNEGRDVGIMRGAAVAIDIASGGIVAMVSTPSFDPNPFVTGYPTKAYNELNTSEDRPFVNRASRGRYSPASTIKPFIGIAAVEENIIDWKKTFLSTGSYSLPNVKRPWRDWKKGGHGRVNLKDAVKESVDSYYYDIAYKMKLETLNHWFDAFGLGRISAVDVDNDSSGINPTREWKRRYRGRNWGPGDTVNLGIGQGDLTVTPLQMAIATTVLARQGAWFAPRLLDKVHSEEGWQSFNPPPSQADIMLKDPRNWTLMNEAMQAVAHEIKGTARNYVGKNLQYRIAAKTGTLQKVSIAADAEYDDVKETLDRRHWDSAWLVAFAPANNPQIAIAIHLENAGSGGKMAMPIARAVFDAYLLDEQGQLKEFEVVDYLALKQQRQQSEINMENAQILAP